MFKTIKTSTGTYESLLLSREDTYSTRVWKIAMPSLEHLSRPLKIELSKAYNFEWKLTSFKSLIDGVLILHEDLMN